MMQDTVLSMSKDSVKQFVEFVLKFIPKDTEIISTSEVKNYFEKQAIMAPGDEEEEPKSYEGIPDD